MKINKRVSQALIAGALAVSMIIPVHASDVTKAEQEASDIQQQMQKAEQEQLELEAQFRSIASELENAQNDLTTKEEQIEQTEEEMVNALVQKNLQYERMKRRIRYMYESDGVSLVEALLTSESMADFLTRAEYIVTLSRRDKAVFTDFQALVQEVEEKQESLQKEYQELRLMQEEIVAKRKKVEALIASNKSQLSELKSDLAKAEKAIAEAKEIERRKNEASQVTKPTKPPQKPSVSQQQPSTSQNAFFTHPCPGMSYQSSYFGEVREGIGDPNPHKGHDYAAPAGTPIYAAAAGTVLIAGYSNSAGNWVVIDHGNGLVTKYMHMYQHPYVSAGQKVARGQQIGGVGTTGQSTGNHLHFQVEEYGVAVNPSKYM